jgi:azurin
MMIARRTIFATAIALVFFSGRLFSQFGGNLAAGMAENAKLLHQYTFKQRTEVMYKGEGKAIRIAQVHFGPDGKREMEIISQTGQEPATGLGHRIINHQREEMKAYADRITALVESYVPPDPEKLRGAMAGAQIDASGALISLTMKNYLHSGDSFGLAVDPATRKLQKFELKTLLDKDPINVTSEMKAIPNGPTYPGLTKVKAPAKNLEIDISQYDFMKL